MFILSIEYKKKHSKFFNKDLYKIANEEIVKTKNFNKLILLNIFYLPIFCIT